MSTDRMIETVRGALDELGRTGSPGRLLDSMTDDVVISATVPPGTPMSGEFRGKDGLLAYFGGMNEVFEILDADMTSIAAGGDRVVVLPVERLRVRRSQREVTLELALVFTFRGDKIARLLAIGDLSAVVDAYREPPAAAYLETQYATPAMMQEFRPATEAWARGARAYRETAGARAQLDVAYGDAARQRLDIFEPEGGAGGPVALFVHGGYWQAMDRSYFSHMARGANAHGITVAVAGYTLCPEVTISAIVDEIRQAVAFVAKHFKKPVTVYGHSAGGHLTACMLATDWPSVDPSLAAGTVPAGLAISGLFELEPLVPTSLNKRLGLDVAEARRLSPLLWQAPAGRSLVACVGGDESWEFRRQTRDMVARWGAGGVAARAVEVPGAGHFSVIAPLSDPESAITRDLVALARGG